MTMDTSQIKFDRVSPKYVDTIFQWLSEAHMQEFWDNSQEHKDDILIYSRGRKEPSPYFNGIFEYWVGSINNEPYCLLLTSKVVEDSTCPEIWKKHISVTGTTYSIDFGIGNVKFLGKGLAALTLETFTNFFQRTIDTNADTFFIDPDENNPKARHVYEKAGFIFVGKFKQKGQYWDFSGDSTCLMVKKLPRST